MEKPSSLSSEEIADQAFEIFQRGYTPSQYPEQIGLPDDCGVAFGKAVVAALNNAGYFTGGEQINGFPAAVASLTRLKVLNWLKNERSATARC